MREATQEDETNPPAETPTETKEEDPAPTADDRFDAEEPARVEIEQEEKGGPPLRAKSRRNRRARRRQEEVEEDNEPPVVEEEEEEISQQTSLPPPQQEAPPHIQPAQVGCTTLLWNGVCQNMKQCYAWLTLACGCGLRPFPLSAQAAVPADLVVPTDAVLSIVIHHVDGLPSEVNVLAPYVSVHVVNASTGRYLPKAKCPADYRSTQWESIIGWKKGPKESAMMSMDAAVEETQWNPVRGQRNGKADGVGADAFCSAVGGSMCTKSVELSAEADSTVTPTVWNEELRVNVSMADVLDPDVLILFEVRDGGTDLRSGHTGDCSAWGYLRTISSGTGDCYVGLGDALKPPTVRVQLFAFKPNTFMIRAQTEKLQRNEGGAATSSDIPMVFWNYMRKWKTDLPLALHATLNSAPLDGFLSEYEEEDQADVDGEEGGEASEGDPRDPTEVTDAVVQRLSRRKDGDQCKIPNRIAASLVVGRFGASALAFARSGAMLAVGSQESAQDFSIRVFDTNSLELKGTFLGHKGTIYSLVWSSSSKYMLSASADGAVMLWEMAARTTADHTVFGRLLTTLVPAPASVVYCAAFLGEDVDGGVPDVAMGTSDGRVLQWMGSHEETALVAETLGRGARHEGGVSCMAVDFQRNTLFTGDLLGKVIVWERSGRSGGRVLHESLEGAPLVAMDINTAQNLLLIQSQRNQLLVLDTRRGIVRAKLNGSHCDTARIGAVLSPDGRFALSGSESGVPLLWRSTTGMAVQPPMFEESIFGTIVSDVAWSFEDHMIAACSYGEASSVLLFEFDRSSGKPGAVQEDKSDVQQTPATPSESISLLRQMLASNHSKSSSLPRDFSQRRSHRREKSEGGNI